MARKTIDIEDLKAQANRALSDPELVRLQNGTHGSGQAFRTGVAMVLESALMLTGNYKGFEFRDGDKGLSDNTVRSYF